MTRKRRYRKVLGIKFNIKGKTTTKAGRRRYMKLYMQDYRKRKKGKHKKKSR